MRLHQWQTEALQKWEDNHFKGIVNVVTGAGKTVLAIAAIARLAEIVNLRVKIIVPKTFLVRQWMDALKSILSIARNDIGLYFGNRKDNPNCRYMIYVVNSARYAFARHILEDYAAGSQVFVIADECHHYGTQENSKIFDFIKMLPNLSQYYTLGLSATPFSKNYESILEPSLGSEIYRFTFSQALEAEIISRFSIFNIGIEFSNMERAEYDELSDKLSIALYRLRKYCPQLRTRNNPRFFSAVESIIKTHKDPDVSTLAQTVIFLSYQRKEIVYFAAARTKCVMDLVRLIDSGAKIIIFGERIEQANEIYQRLNRRRNNEAGLFHSKLHGDVRKMALRQFEDSQIRILVSCKTLDEGLNVSEADVGIIASSTSRERQRIQRLGRILRKKAGGRHAYFYHLYVKGTMEENEVFDELNDDMIKGVNIIDLYYDEKCGTFSNPYYDELTHTAIKNAKATGWSCDKISELRRNINAGVIVCDWLLSEAECMHRINAAELKRERNYYISMLYLIRARQNLKP